MKLTIIILFLITSLQLSAKDPNLYDTLFQSQNIEYFGLDNTKIVALTFDDGPGQGTERILDFLKSKNIKATFFALGKQIKANPALVKRIVAEGHLLANHSFDHDNLSQGKYSSDPRLLVSEIQETHQLITKYTGAQPHYFFRAPFGSWSRGHEAVLNADSELNKYIGPICWDSGRIVEYQDGQIKDAADWQCWSSKINQLSPQQCAKGYIKRTMDIGGGVMLMHDIHSKTAEMTEFIVNDLLDKGFQFVRIDQIPEVYRYLDPMSFKGAQVPDFTYSQYRGRCLLKKKNQSSI